jgi:hypothetical protein
MSESNHEDGTDTGQFRMFSTPFAIILQFTDIISGKLLNHFNTLIPLNGEPINFDNENALLAALTPDKGGLILSEPAQSEDQLARCAIYLPKVWSRFPAPPDPADFVRSLKQKGG